MQFVTKKKWLMQSLDKKYSAPRKKTKKTEHYRDIMKLAATVEYVNEWMHDIYIICNDNDKQLTFPAYEKWKYYTHKQQGRARWLLRHYGGLI